jgi:peptide/nickel transport system substrate-binding protein
MTKCLWIGLDKLKIKLHAADGAFRGAVDAAILYKAHAEKAGIDIEVVREPSDGYWSNVWAKKPWCASYWGGYSTENAMLSTRYAPGAPWNETQWDHERFNNLMMEARSELDETKRREMYAEMQRILRDEGGAVVPMFANAILARNDKVAHGKLGGNLPLDGRRLIERWWMS